jgi:hypothetical protein
MKNKLVKFFIITTFVTLYVIVSLISCIHTIDFFLLSNPRWLAISLAIAFEIGAAASLASIIVLDKMNKTIIWFLFIILTFMQAMGNTYFAYVNVHDFQGWIELFGLVDYDIITQKRILAVVSGAILPLIALGFIKSLVDYLKPEEETKNSLLEENNEEDKDEIIKSEVTQPIDKEEIIETNETENIQPITEDINIDEVEKKK